MNNKKVLQELIKKLSGLNWFFISGFAVEIYTNGKRKSKDWDLVVKEADEFARRIGCTVEHRKINKGAFIVDDFGFETEFCKQPIEVTTGYPKFRRSGSLEELFEFKVKKDYFGIEVFVLPIEELIVHKAIMYRIKDVADLKLLSKCKFDPRLIHKFANDWKEHDKVLKTLNELDYKL